MVCSVPPHLTVDRLLEYLPRLKPWQQDAMRQILLALTMGIAVLSVAAPARAEDYRTYGVELEGFDYPHDVYRYAFRSQGSDLFMAYMDVKPQTANGRTAVLLHGRNFCAATWEKTIAVLSKAGFRVIAPDQIGFCKSTKPLGYQFSIQQLATNTNALLTSLGVSRPIVIGHSLGGMTAMRYALMFPDAVERIILVNPIGLEDWQAAGVPFIDLDKVSRSRRQRPSTVSSNTSRGSTMPASGGLNTTVGWRCSPACIAGRAPNALRRCRRGLRRWLSSSPSCMSSSAFGCRHC